MSILHNLTEEFNILPVLSQTDTQLFKWKPDNLVLELFWKKKMYKNSLNKFLKNINKVIIFLKDAIEKPEINMWFWCRNRQ